MRTLDASAIVYAWDNYPVDQLPGLWEWIAKEIEQKKISIPAVAFIEVRDVSPDCAKWLADAGIAKLPESNDILAEAVRIKNLLGIQNDQFHPKGVDENDVIIIATAKIESLELISNESAQKKTPKELAKLKIPAVCDLPDVGVVCKDFIRLIKDCGEVFR